MKPLKIKPFPKSNPAEPEQYKRAVFNYEIYLKQLMYLVKDTTQEFLVQDLYYQTRKEIIQITNEILRVA